MTITMDADTGILELAKTIDQFGDPVTVRQRTSGTYDTNSGEATVTNTDYTTKGKVFSYRNYNVDGNLVLMGDRRLLLVGDKRLWKPSVYKPVQGDQVLYGGAVWNVVSPVKEIMLQGKKMCYIAQLRGQQGG